MGVSKFVKLSRKNLYHNTQSIIKYLKLNKRDRAITNMPFYYSYMLSIINTHLEVGGSVIVTKHSIVQKPFWELFKNYKVSSFNGVPYTYEILSKIGLKKIYSKNLKYITQAGGKIDNSIAKKIYYFFNKKNIRFFVMYGQTEASPRISFLSNSEILNKIGSIGRPIDGVKIYLKDKRDSIIKKPNKSGNIICQGKNVMHGYSYSFKDLINKTKPLKELNTGDIGYFDKDKYFYITSRAKRIAKIYGNRLDLNELELKMRQYGFKINCITRNNKIIIFYTKNFNKNLNLLKKLFKITKQNLQAFIFYPLKSLPRTKTGKINYFKLQGTI